MTNCERCGKPTESWTMSRFNTEKCCPACIDKEKKHPLYPAAVAAEADEIKKGNFNYPGIGKPNDL